MGDGKRGMTPRGTHQPDKVLMGKWGVSDNLDKS